MSSDVKDWCRIFDTKHGKVLIYIAFDVDEDSDVIHQIIKSESLCIGGKLSGFEDELTQEAFDKFATQERAEAFARKVLGFLNIK